MGFNEGFNIQMRFEHPEVLYWLWLVIPLAVFFVWKVRRRRRLLADFARDGIWEELCASVSWRVVKRKQRLLLAVFVLSLFALARPQWGFELQEVRRQGVDILLAVDVSKSMLTTDVAPNRLERTKLAIRDLISGLKGDRVGIIGFAGDAFLLCPLSSDYGGVLLSLEDLKPASIPRGGTNVGAAIEEAMRVFAERRSAYKAVVILTDGENLEGDPLAAAKKAKDQGVKIYTVGIGTQEGELIQVADEQGKVEFLKDSEGNFVKSRLNEGLLQKIALATGGVYVRSGGSQSGLDIIYDRALSKLDKTEFDSEMKRRYFERFQWPLAVAFLLLFIETILPVRKRK